MKLYLDVRDTKSIRRTEIVQTGGEDSQFGGELRLTASKYTAIVPSHIIPMSRDRLNVP